MLAIRVISVANFIFELNNLSQTPYTDLTCGSLITAQCFHLQNSPSMSFVLQAPFKTYFLFGSMALKFEATV